MTPSLLKKQFPFGSIAQNTETEIIAMNIAKILSGRGDTFRLLTWEEYVEWRKADGATDYDCQIEHRYFEVAAPYLETAEEAAKFSDMWAKLLQGEKDDKPAPNLAEIFRRYGIDSADRMAKQHESFFAKDINGMLREKWDRDHPHDLDQIMVQAEYPEREILEEGVAEYRKKFGSVLSPKPSKLTESLIELFGGYCVPGVPIRMEDYDKLK